MTSKTRHTDIAQQGREFFQQKDYEGALKLFNTVLSKEENFPLTVSERLSALDHRAAIFIKLGNNQSALEDGRKMIKVKKGDCQGYLRAGMACELMTQYGMASGVYKYGLGNVSPSETNYKVLKMKFERMMCKGKPVDPVSALPAELLEIIMKHLSFAEFAQALRVSMSWYNALTIITGLWTRIDLTEARKPVSMNTVRDYVRRSRNGMTRASLSFSTMSGDDMLSYILSHAKGLKHLDINFGDALDGPKLLRLAPFLAALRVLVITSDIDIHFDTVWQLLRLCKNLTRAEFHSVQELTVEQEWSDDMSNIRSLTINCSADQSSSIAFLNFTDLFQRIPEVEYLCLRHWTLRPEHMDFRPLTKLQHLDASHSTIFVFPTLPESIQILNLSTCVFLPIPGLALETGIQTNFLPRLRCLMMSFAYLLGIVGLQSLLTPNKGNLTTLRLEFCSRLTNEDLVSLMENGYFRSVTDLSLAACDIKDAAVEVLAATSPHLTALDLDYTKVTGVAVKALVLKPGRKLERLSLKNCGRVGADAVDLARGSGVTVVFTFPDRTRRARKKRRM